MKKILLLSIISLVLLFGCKDEAVAPGTAMETGNEFIRASLDGDFDKAEKLLLEDPENQQLFDSYKKFYTRLPEDTKKHYKDAAYVINKYLDVDDSTALINYSNDYMKKPMDLKLVRVQKLWKVDFKYMSSGNLPLD